MLDYGKFELACKKMDAKTAATELDLFCAEFCLRLIRECESERTVRLFFAVHLPLENAPKELMAVINGFWPAISSIQRALPEMLTRDIADADLLYPQEIVAFRERATVPGDQEWLRAHPDR